MVTNYEQEDPVVVFLQKIVVPVYTDTYMGGAQRQVSWAVILSENSRLFSVYCLVRKEMEWINRGLRLHQKIKRSDQVWFACNVSSCCYCFSSVYCPRMSNTISSCVCEWVCVCVLQFVGDTTMPLKSLFVHKRKRRGGGGKETANSSDPLQMKPTWQRNQSFPLRSCLFCKRTLSL